MKSKAGGRNIQLLFLDKNLAVSWTETRMAVNLQPADEMLKSLLLSWRWKEKFNCRNENVQKQGKQSKGPFNNRLVVKPNQGAWVAPHLSGCVSSSELRYEH